MLSRTLVAATLKPIALSVLRDGETYGYQIIDRIRKISDGKIQVETGTLYPFLHRLEADGLVQSKWKDVPNAPRRKYYSLTRKGRKALDRERREWMEANAIMAGLWGAGGVLSAVDS
jgi:DNA-binding PadR family transcriptional regulator